MEPIDKKIIINRENTIKKHDNEKRDNVMMTMIKGRNMMMKKKCDNDNENVIITMIKEKYDEKIMMTMMKVVLR